MHSFMFLAILRPTGHMQLSLCSVSNLSELSDRSDCTLIPLSPTKSQFEFATFENKDIVELSAVENASTVWIRAVKYDEFYNKLLSEINMTTPGIPIDEIENDAVILSKYCGDYSRGTVIDANADTATIQLMDIGLTINAKKGMC